MRILVRCRKDKRAQSSRRNGGRALTVNLEMKNPRDPGFDSSQRVTTLVLDLTDSRVAAARTRGIEANVWLGPVPAVRLHALIALGVDGLITGQVTDARIAVDLATASSV